MLRFHKLSVSDFERLYPVLYRADCAGADTGFHNMYFWDCYYGEVGYVADFVTQHITQEEKEVYLFPIGSGNLKEAIEALESDAKERGGKFRLRGVTPDKKAALEALFPEKFVFTPYRDSFDYIYTVEELTELHGKKLQAKRNHCNRFAAEHPDYVTVEVTEENIDLCREMAREWYAVHESSEQIEQEKTALARAFDSFAQTKMDGLILMEGERVLAFSMGARMNEKYYDVCFEKAFSAINGAYAVINREFARMIAEKYPEVEFLNREDDMGELGLRRAKESYQPTLLLEKYVADLREDAPCATDE